MVMDTYTIENLDCANCAMKIESALKKIDGFEKASINFSTQSVKIPSGIPISLVQETISRIEPDARLAERKEGASEDAHGSRRKLIQIISALVFFLSGIVWKQTSAHNPNLVVEYVLFLTAYIIVGLPVLLHAVRSLKRGRMFDEMFLMSIATIGAICIHELAEAVGVMLFYAVGEWLQEKAVDNSRRSISSLISLRPDKARIIEGEGTEEVDPQTVEPGSYIQVRSGERIPLDGTIVSGSSRVDTSALTGESVPRMAEPGDDVLSGFVNDNGTLVIRVTKRYEDSEVARILTLVEESAAKKAPTEKFISKFASIYTPIIVGISLAVAFLPPLFTSDPLSIWVYRALVILVISCPCALVISVPLGYFGGIGAASKKGILMKGATYIDTLKDVHTIVFDKTGTLTQGNFSVVHIVPSDLSDRESLLSAAARGEAHSSHPIAESIRQEYMNTFPDTPLTDFNEYSEMKGYGVIAGNEGERVLVGSARFLESEGISVPPLTSSATIVHAAKNNSYLGYIEIADQIKADAVKGIADLKKAGVKDLIMLTGDSEEQASSVAARLGIKRWYSSLLPHEKVEKVEELMQSLEKGKRLAFVGDGVNDAPVLMHSDIGISMGAMGSDAAIEAADIVLMDDKIEGVAYALAIARRTRKVVIQNIVLALIVKGFFLSLGVFGIATMWEAVIADVGVALAAVLNSTRTMKFPDGGKKSG